MRIAILGSCVTRDAFAAHPEALGKPSEYFARTALASAMSPVVVSGVDLGGIPSAFQRRVVGYDLDRTFLDFLDRGDFDLLIVDLIDERFPVLLLADGGLVTHSNEFRHASVQLEIVERVEPWTEHSFELWNEAWTLLIDHLRERGSLDRLVINEVVWADSVAGGGTMPDAYPAMLTTRANFFLGRMSARMREDLVPSQFFTYKRSLLTAASDHQWGIAPFHYVPEYYAEFVRHVEQWLPPSNDAAQVLVGKPDVADGAAPSSVNLTPRSVTRRGGALARSAAALRGFRSSVQARDLVISFLFPPTAETSGIVAAKRIAERGTPVDVIASEPPPGRVPDETALEAANGLVRRTVRLPSIGNELRDWSIIEHFCALGEGEIDLLEREQGVYRSVYSRSMMPASHVLAALYKVAHPNVPWTAEFSDPLLTDTLGERRLAPIPDTPITRRLRSTLEERGVAWPGDNEMFAFVELLVWLLADEVVFTNDVQRRLMLTSIGDDDLAESVEQRAVVRSHPTPSATLYERAKPVLKLDPGVLNLAYFGVFFGVRTVNDLTEALGRLEQGERERVRLFIFTNKPVRTRRRVQESGLDDVVRVRKLVPYLDFLALTRRFDGLVLTDSRATPAYGVNPYLPSKLSDYLGSGTPVWALVEPSSPTSRTPGITTTPLGDVDAAVAELRAWIAKPRARNQ